MAKYVCDFDQVKACGEAICQSAGDLSSAISKYSSDIDSSLFGWEGKASNSFEQANSSEEQKSLSHSEYINSFGNFVKEAAKSIEDLESELAELSI